MAEKLKSKSRELEDGCFRDLNRDPEFLTIMNGPVTDARVSVFGHVGV